MTDPTGKRVVVLLPGKKKEKKKTFIAMSQHPPAVRGPLLEGNLTAVAWLRRWTVLIGFLQTV
jgi:hypothetical protein